MVIIDHGNGYRTLYGHMRTGSLTVEAGSRVSQGQKIGVMGSTGRSTGPHLHFEVIGPQGVDSTQEDKSESAEDASHKHQPSGPVPVRGEADERRGNSAFDAPQRRCKGGGRVTPAECIDDGVEKCREAVEECSGGPEMNEARGQNDPPAVKDFFH